MPQDIEIDAEYKLRKLSPEIIMNITLVETKEYKIRRAVALWLIKLATIILGCGIEVENDNGLLP